MTSPLASHRVVKNHQGFSLTCVYNLFFTTCARLMIQRMYKTNGTTVPSKSLLSCSDPAVGIHHSRLGNSLLHIPQREYHQHMTRAPLTLGHLACCLPLQPSHTGNACVYAHMCHGQQPLTRHAALRQKEITERKSVGEEKRRRRKEWWGAPEHACVKRLCYECDEVIDGKVLCAKGHPPFFTLSSSITPNTQGSVHVQEKKNTSSTFSSGLGRGLLTKTDNMTRQSAAQCKIYRESTHQMHTKPLSCMGHCTTGMSMCECMYKERDVPISTLFEAHGLSRNVRGEDGSAAEGGEVEGREARAVIWEGYPTAQTSTWSIHSTVGPAHRERHTDRKSYLSINSGILQFLVGDAPSQCSYWLLRQ